MKPKTMILMVAAVACGLVASYMTSRLLADRNTAPVENQVSIVFAKKKVPAYTNIKNPEEFFEVRQVADGPDRAKAIRNLEDLRGKRLKKAVSEDAFVRTDDLQQKGEEVVEIPKGMRAIAIKVTAESLAGGFILPGNHVDVLCTIRGNNDPASMCLLQNMLVIAIDMKPTRDDGQVAVVGQTATLAATPEECERLSLAASLGELRLTLRSPEDTRLVHSTPTRPGDLVKEVRDRAGPGEGPELTPVAPGTPLPVPVPVTNPVTDKPAEQPAPKKFAMRIVEGPREQQAVFTWDEKNQTWLNGTTRSAVDDDASASKPTPKK
jgi:Flp pilus assembly protein CpaB